MRWIGVRRSDGRPFFVSDRLRDLGVLLDASCPNESCLIINPWEPSKCKTEYKVLQKMLGFYGIDRGDVYLQSIKLIESLEVKRVSDIAQAEYDYWKAKGDLPENPMSYKHGKWRQERFHWLPPIPSKSGDGIAKITVAKVSKVAKKTTPMPVDSQEKNLYDFKHDDFSGWLESKVRDLENSQIDWQAIKSQAVENWSDKMPIAKINIEVFLFKKRKEGAK